MEHRRAELGVLTVSSSDPELVSAATRYLLDPAARADPEDLYARLHESGVPVSLWDDTFLVARHEDVSRVFRRRDTSTVPRTRGLAATPDVDALFLRQLPYRPDAEHAVLRRVVAGSFGARDVDWLDELVRAETASLLDVCRAGGAGDVVGFAARLTAKTSCALLGARREDWERLSEWGAVLYREIGSGPPQRTASEAAVASLRRYVTSAIDSDRVAFANRTGATIVDAARTGLISRDDAVAYVALFLLTGRDLLTHAISNALLFLASYPAKFAELRADAASARALLDEVLRLWGPVRLCVRHLAARVELTQATLPAGATAMLLIHAANRDPDVFADPNVFRPARDARFAFAFGHGPRACLGAFLARRVGERVLLAVAAALRRVWVDAAPRPLESLPLFGVQDWRMRGTTA